MDIIFYHKHLLRDQSQPDPADESLDKYDEIGVSISIWLIGEKKPDPIVGLEPATFSIAGQHFNQQATRT